jgi:hypothetical protein
VLGEIVAPRIGHPSRMTDHTQEDLDETQRERESETDDLLEEQQEGKGYGEDDGEREDALP